MVFRGKDGHRRFFRVEATGGIELQLEDGKATEVTVVAAVKKP